MTSHHDDPLRDLIHSTLAFYARFDITPNVTDALRNFQEEVHELAEAALDGENSTHIAEEAADVFVTAIGVCWAAGIEPEALIEQVYAVVAKNDAKNHRTHVVSGGKIRRRDNGA